MRAQQLCSVLAMLATAGLAAAQALPPQVAVPETLPMTPNVLPPTDPGVPSAAPPVMAPGILAPVPGQQPMPTGPQNLQPSLPPGSPQNTLPPLPPGTTTLDGSLVPGPASGDCCTLPDHIADDGPGFPEHVPYGPRGRFWAGVSYLHWWTRTAPTPPLLRISPGNGSSSTSSSTSSLSSVTSLTGVSAFVPTTTTTTTSTTPLLVGSPTGQPGQSGGRFTLGYAPDPQGSWSIEGDFLFLSEFSGRLQPALTSSQTLSRPFVDATTGTLTGLVISSSGVATGTAIIADRVNFYGGETNLRYLLGAGPRWYTSFLTGLRLLELNEALEVDTFSAAQVSDTAVRADILAQSDRFGTRNFFYGGQVGLDNEWAFDRLYLRLRGKLGAGITHQSVRIDGATAGTDFGSAPFLPVAGGLLAQPSNIGHYSRDRFSLVPELNLGLGYWLTRHLRVEVGYTFLYWTRVARASDQIDPVVNPSAISLTGVPAVPAGPVRPLFLFRDSDFWAQGVNFTLDLRY